MISDERKNLDALAESYIDPILNFMTVSSTHPADILAFGLNLGPKMNLKNSVR